MRPSLAVLAAAVQAAVSAASTLTPPVLPLTVRNPYLSTWLGDAREVPWSKWPMFYTGEEIGLSLMAQVPSTGIVYPLVGKPQDYLSGAQVEYPTYLGSKYDASTTNLTYRIDPTIFSASNPVEITISFLSPITPTSTLRQSIPASYITIHVLHADEPVNVYMDLNGRWVSGDAGSTIVWQHDTFGLEEKKPTLQKWQFRRQNELLLSEIRDRAEWGTLHFTGPADVQYQSGDAHSVRSIFATKGAVQNVNDEGFRAIGDREPVFAFSKSFNPSKKAAKSDSSVTFTVALIQDPVVQFASARGLTLMKPLWQSWFGSVEELLSFHHSDFDHAATLAADYSDQLAKDAYQSGADDYVDIVALSARQVMGATTFSGTPDDPILFLKEISSNGNFQTIDVIFPAFPFFLYTNPRWLAYLLEPLIEHMLSGQYPNTYAMHDLGTHFPNATGHPDGNDEYMPVEECGNILIMGLAIVNSLRYSDDSAAASRWSTQGVSPQVSEPHTGYFPLGELQALAGIDRQDGKWGGGAEGERLAEKWVQRSYRLWSQWTGYLVEFSLEPANQLSTDDFAGWLALQTNLALKGIIGINAMSKLAEVAGHSADASYFKNISDTYIAKWEQFGMSRDGSHAKLAYDWYGSWTTIYNLYADAQLCFHLEGTDLSPKDQLPRQPQTPLFTDDKGKKNPSTPGFVPHHIYTRQSIWYHHVRQKYGLPLDSRHLYTKTDWEFFAMAVASERTRSEILESVAKWVNETVTDRPFTDLHNTEGRGEFPGPNFFARPVVGGHFAFLALQRACGGRAMDGLAFLDEGDAKTLAEWEVAAANAADELRIGGWGSGYGSENGEL
ncbi:putative glutaminase [Aspergillus clavatus NRRL 1]|uniref:Glutaminase, putative n=1 Tax=Aspergillus clavatus (strain ATCC 1007 / CBS 513.65 / DSM 816 / NCTC 3887 / NRRL 1 / QM 1276 / 107) TaxID=344612 RepID=A1CKJ2_ASPCL|nr:glutaminase, putative [Aspergillus clavatus NRRL 1]EAW09666.1 glutaminase, putative [Aspergillus clavatus NRRL 1]